ncbi:mono/diheme cytochrome c family protein [Rubricella aquisinus]|uniref:Mono/diheme cytochrome c family protein n=1 Tax=Rubricella aquisinus TaxID=2028108 RepID=A0A840X0N1_9RHOB|nr:hypothetical protein [Rubricella aquisinus]MBB5515436.1 mono/diheme cytochrome c family protein [Rubricella aquisinus]
MGASTNAILGGVFVLLALGLTILMFHLWGYPFDKTRHRSSAPRALMFLHRAFGYVFVAIYVVLMWDMVPRLWSYQIELPARTVFHLMLGMAVGALLLVKILVVRFFKHLESTLAPILGTALLICTILLAGLALPYAAREAYLRATAQDGQNFSQERIDRVTTYLPQIGFADAAGLATLASAAGLAEGRDVLTRKCTQCHDLRTILVKPRTPEAWHSTVTRMAQRATTMHPISESEQWSVTAYLIAITPTLQQGVQDSREEALASSQSFAALRATNDGPPDDYDPQAARAVFAAKCAQCHSPALVEAAGFRTEQDVVQLVTRMVANGLTASEGELGQIMAYLTQTYAREGG